MGKIFTRFQTVTAVLKGENAFRATLTTKRVKIESKYPVYNFPINTTYRKKERWVPQAATQFSHTRFVISPNKIHQSYYVRRLLNC